MKDAIEILKAVIPIGKKNAIHLKELSEALGVKESVAKKYVQEARRKGSIICSGQVGYWIPESDTEIKSFASEQRKQALSRLKTTKPMRDSLKEYKGQISLSDVSEGVIDNAEKHKE